MSKDRNPRRPAVEFQDFVAWVLSDHRNRPDPSAEELERKVRMIASLMLELTEYTASDGFGGFMAYLEGRPCVVCRSTHPDPPSAATVRQALARLLFQLRRAAAS